MTRIKKDDRQKQLDQTRQRLLEAAAEEFARHGFPGANINTISTAAGYAKGTVYNYFPSKRALLLALIDETAHRHLEFVCDRVRPEPNPARRLERFYLAGFEFVTLYLSRMRVILNTLNGPEDPLKIHLFEVYQPMFKFVADEILTYGMQLGALRKVEPTQMATLLMTIYLGTATQLDLQGHPFLDPLQVAGLALHGLLKEHEVADDHA